MNRVSLAGVPLAGAILIGTPAIVVRHVLAAPQTPNVCEAGYLCGDTGPGETGTQYKVKIPPGTPAGTCFNLAPEPTKIVSADNETDKARELINGQCGPNAKPDPKDTVQPKTKEDLPDPVDVAPR